MLLEVYEVYQRNSQNCITFKSKEKFNELIDTIFCGFEYDLCGLVNREVTEEDLKEIERVGYFRD